MHDHRNADDRAQRAVLSLVLFEHPTLLAASEIEREIGAGDATDRAVRDLTRVGLLRREGVTVLPTQAALHFDRLAAWCRGAVRRQHPRRTQAGRPVSGGG
jgi:hypothetical protein